MSELSRLILEKIEKEHIRPRPRWQFILLYALLWMALLVSVLLGSLGISVILISFSGESWNVIRELSGNTLFALLAVLPYVWIFFLVLVLFSANRLFTKTKQGYRYRPLAITLTSVMVSFGLGGFFHVFGLGYAFEEVLVENVKPYAVYNEKQEQVLDAPEKGVMLGEVEAIKEETVVMKDAHKNTWEVELPEMKEGETIPLKKGMKMVVSGKKKEGNVFQAKKTAPWKVSRSKVNKMTRHRFRKRADFRRTYTFPTRKKESDPANGWDHDFRWGKEGGPRGANTFYKKTERR